MKYLAWNINKPSNKTMTQSTCQNCSRNDSWTIMTRMSSNFKKLKTLGKEKWAEIPVRTYHNQVMKYEHQLQTMIANKDFAIYFKI